MLNNLTKNLVTGHNVVKKSVSPYETLEKLKKEYFGGISAKAKFAVARQDNKNILKVYISPDCCEELLSRVPAILDGLAIYVLPEDVEKSRIDVAVESFAA